MCGFVGMFKNGLMTDEEKILVLSMTKKIDFRGPDEGRGAVSNNAAFGFRRLSIIDLEKGSQPFEYNGGRYVGVFNGEIYNYKELREKLIGLGFNFKTNSEIEVMLTLYHIEGENFIKRLRGMFAFAILDKKTNKIMLGRDPFGIKPLYYVKKNDRVVFSSEAKAFYGTGLIDDNNVNKTMLQHYFTYQYIPEPDTLNDEIKILPAGNYLVCDFEAEEKVKITRYYTPKFRPVSSDDFEGRAREVREVLEDSVKHHMIADVDVGTFLSGGIDSAVITALSSKIHPGIKAFTVAFGEREYSEIDEASSIAKHLDVEHIKLVAGLEDFKRAFDKVVYHLDFPVADPSTVAIYLICEEAAKHLKVVLSGEGSDELFGGYRVYNESAVSSKIYALPGGVKKVLSKVSYVLPDGVKGKQLLYRGTTPLDRRYVGNAFIFDENEKREIYNFCNDEVHFYDLTKSYYNDTLDLDPMTRMQYVDMNTWLKGDILVKGDRLSMAHSLEVRVPFLDKEVFEVASRLAPEDKLKCNTTKYILRYAFRDLVDEDTFMRPKLGYPVPVRKWLKNELFDWAEDIIKNSPDTKYVNKAKALELLYDHREGKEDNYRKIWTVLVLLRWLSFYTTEEGKKAKRDFSPFKTENLYEE